MSNKGKVIQNIAYVILFLGIIGSLVASILLIPNASVLRIHPVVLFFCVLIGGCLSSFVIFALLDGFGDLIQNIQDIRTYLIVGEVADNILDIKHILEAKNTTDSNK